MKAQRRHELKTNQLAKSLETFPEKLARHANKIIFAALAIVLILLLIRYRINSTEARHEQAESQLADVQTELASLQASPPDQAREYRLESQVLDKLDSIDGVDSDMPDVAARALVARGDANLALAMGAYSGIEPPDHPETPEEYLTGAQDAYSEVIEKYADQELPAITARFGLATIAEDRHQWDEARSEYQAIVKQPDVGEVFKNYAQAKLDQLKSISQPVYEGEASLNLGTTLPSSEATEIPPAATTRPLMGPPAPAHATTRPATR